MNQDYHNLVVDENETITFYRDSEVYKIIEGEIISDGSISGNYVSRIKKYGDTQLAIWKNEA